MSEDNYYRYILRPIKILVRPLVDKGTYVPTILSQSEIQDAVDKGYSFETLEAAQGKLYNTPVKLKDKYPSAYKMLAKYEGYCPACGEKMKPGISIRFVKNIKTAWHELCWQNK